MQPTCIHCLTTHRHVWFAGFSQPNLWATATLMASSYSLSPTAVIGDTIGANVAGIVGVATPNI